MASDLVLLPFVDGLSTRRSTLMAALAHGRPVLALVGKNTDRVLLDAPGAVALTPVGDRAAFALVAVELLRKPGLRAELGDRGRRLYEERFAWPVTGRRMVQILSGMAAAAPLGI